MVELDVSLLRAQLGGLQAAYDELRPAYSSLMRLVGRSLLRAQLGDLQAAYDELRPAYSSLMRLVGRMNIELSHLRATVDELPRATVDEARMRIGDRAEQLSMDLRAEPCISPPGTIGARVIASRLDKSGSADRTRV
jgi:hypothetical protein